MQNPSGQAEVWRESMERFEQWLDLPEGEKVGFLTRVRQQEPALFPHLEALIRADSDAEFEHFLAASAVADLPPDPALPPAEVPTLQGTRIGPWTLDRLLGTGGMGQVWLASRHDGLYIGETAIKMLREPAFNTAADERFAREGQILARLTHPNIARLLDAGYSSTLRQRYLVLEYVVGQRVDAYCDEHRLDLPARIRVFLQICRAVSHAHANLVVHRDLKPSNVLVLADGTVKLLDFGVAKLLEDTDGTPAATTELTRMVGAALTPEYAAPEQVAGGAITTATDVYALGVLLYRLLSGCRPYGKTSDTPLQLAQAIIDAAPLRLSQLAMPAPASDDTCDLPTLAARRSMTPERLAAALKGDLDNIVAKALKKAPEERYATVQELADDLDRYLQHLPVKARPDSLRYRLGKFVRRHRLAVSLSAAATAALIAGVTLIVVQARYAREQEQLAQAQARIADQQRQRAQEQADLALRREREAQEAAAAAERFRLSAENEAGRARASEILAQQRFELANRLAAQAQAEGAKATATRDFLLDIFRTNTRTQTNPIKARQTTARELLDIGSNRVDQRLASQPVVRQQVLGVLTDLYTELGEFEKARHMALARVDALQQISPAPKRELAEAKVALALSQRALRDGKAAALALQESGDLLDALGDHRSELRARWWLERGKLTVFTDTATAGMSLRKAGELFDQLSTAPQEPQHCVLTFSGMLAGQLGDWNTALSLYQRALQFALANSGEVSYTTALSHNRLGTALTDAFGDYDEGLKQLRLALDKISAVMGPDNAETQSMKLILAVRLAEAGRHDEGLALLDGALADAERLESRVGRRADTDSLRRAKAEVLLLTGQFAKAAQVLATTRAEGRAENANLREVATDLRLQVAQGRFDEARDFAARALATQARNGNDRLPKILQLLLAKVELHLAGGELDAAEAGLKHIETLAATHRGQAPAIRIGTALRKAELKLARGDAQAALQQFAAARSLVEAGRQPSAYPELLSEILAGTGRAQLAIGDQLAACSNLQQAATLRQRVSGPGSPWLARTQASLGECLARQGQLASAAALLPAVQASYAQAGPLGPQFTRPLQNLAKLLPPSSPPLHAGLGR